jgi:hypothetical protein
MYHMYVPHNNPSNLSPIYIHYIIISRTANEVVAATPRLCKISASRVRGIYFMMLVAIISALSSEELSLTGEVPPLLKQKSIAIFGSTL